MEYEHSAAMLSSFDLTQSLLRQPHAYMCPKIYRDGNKWCALYGDDLMMGVGAFGNTPQQAAESWDLVWINGNAIKNTPSQDRCEDCNSELSPCGAMGVDGIPSTDCKPCQLRDKISTLRKALVELVGADGKELDGMEALIRISPVSNDDRVATINAIHALRET